MSLNKDILGILVLKLEIKDVLKLHLICKKFNEYIKSYNKFWFLKKLNRETLVFNIGIYLMEQFLKYKAEYPIWRPEWFSQTDINIINNNLLKYYKNEKYYFKKYLKFSMIEKIERYKYNNLYHGKNFLELIGRDLKRKRQKLEQEEKEFQNILNIRKEITKENGI